MGGSESGLKGYSVDLPNKILTQHSVFSWISIYFYALFGLFSSDTVVKTLKLIYLMHLNLKQQSESINQQPTTVK